MIETQVPVYPSFLLCPTFRKFDLLFLYENSKYNSANCASIVVVDTKTCGVVPRNRDSARLCVNFHIEGETKEDALDLKSGICRSCQ